MSILHFPRFRKVTAKSVEAGWSQSDMAEFYRAHKLLNDHGILIGLDQGITDENEPWLVFYDHETHDVFLHIARIDGTCILICEHLSIKITEKTIDPLIRQFEHTVRDLLDSRSKQNSNVITHPAARIITTVAAVFLLFKMENSRAYASTHTDKSKLDHTDFQPMANNDWRSSSIHRSQINRIFENIDTPLHAAMMAGLIISNAIASEKISNKAESSNYAFLMSNESHNNTFLPTNDITEFHEHQLHSELYVGAEININNPIQDHVSVQFYVPYSNNVPQISNVNEKNPMMDFFEIHKFDLTPEEVKYAEAKQPGGSSVSDTDENKNTAIDNDIALVIKSIKTDAVFSIIQYLSSSAFEDDFDLTVNVNNGSAKISYITDALIDKIPSEPIEDDTPPVEDIPIKLQKIGDLSILDLDNVADNVERYFETKLHYADLGEMMRIIFSQFEGFEIEVAGGNLLVEQAGIDDSLYSEVGLWTNLMADGSEVSFIGSLDIIDDITAYMA